jgi:ABC-type multidrug transport system ATPase subunit
MTALMGSSGAGKTTLLDCLCYRKTMGTIKGDILLGGTQVQPKTFRKKVGYVEQFGVG